MTPFEFVFALISVITSLALTHLISGVVAILRHENRRMSLVHALWVWIAFAVVVGNWGALWSVQDATDWPAPRVFGWLVSMTTLYAFSALVMPAAVAADEPLDLHQFHAREGRRYIMAHNLFAGVAALAVAILGGVGRASAAFLLPSLLALCLGLAAWRLRGRWQLAASVAVAALATGFMVMQIDILAD